MLRGLTTVTYLAGDVAAAVDWYTDLLGVEPYFSRPVEGRLAYVEFRVGDYQHELGILDRRFAAPGRSDKAGGAIQTVNLAALNIRANHPRNTRVCPTLRHPAT